MASVKYFIKGKKEFQSINIRFYNGRKFDLKKSTGLFIKSKYWNNKKGCLNNNKFLKIKNLLSLLREHIIVDYNNSYSAGIIINSKWLEKSIQNFKDGNERVIEESFKKQNSVDDISEKFEIELNKYSVHKPCVYFLIHEEKVVYVGQSKCLPLRINQHLQEGVKLFDKINYTKLPEKNLNHFEKKMIKYFSPKYNLAHNA